MFIFFNRCLRVLAFVYIPFVVIVLLLVLWAKIVLSIVVVATALYCYLYGALYKKIKSTLYAYYKFILILPDDPEIPYCRGFVSEIGRQYSLLLDQIGHDQDTIHKVIDDLETEIEASNKIYIHTSLDEKQQEIREQLYKDTRTLIDNRAKIHEKIFGTKILPVLTLPDDLEKMRNGYIYLRADGKYAYLDLDKNICFGSLHEDDKLIFFSSNAENTIEALQTKIDDDFNFKYHILDVISTRKHGTKGLGRPDFLSQENYDKIKNSYTYFWNEYMDCTKKYIAAEYDLLAFDNRHAKKRTT